jgi:putative flippase GtrA
MAVGQKPGSGRSLKRTLPAFVLAGGIGFLADAGALALILKTGAHPLLARLVSILIALFVTWRINRRITFHAAGMGTWGEFARYLSVGASTSVLNYAVFAVLVSGFGLGEFMALTMASLLAMAASYFGYDRLVFSGSRGKD